MHEMLTNGLPIVVGSFIGYLLGWGVQEIVWRRRAPKPYTPPTPYQHPLAARGEWFPPKQ